LGGSESAVGRNKKIISAIGIKLTGIGWFQIAVMEMC
jgi:predicted nucleic acid-binding Zn ribbon protein